MKEEKTKQKKGVNYDKPAAASGSGVVRLITTLVIIGVEVAVFVVIAFYLQDIGWLSFVIYLIAVFVSIGIYSTYKTSAFKIPWILLIMGIPPFGLVLYVVIAHNNTTKKMRLRYAKVDRRIMPLMKQDPNTMKQMEWRSRSIASVSHYLSDTAGFPVYKHTSVEYYSEAVYGLEAQIAELEKAQKFIFMEYHAVADDKSFTRVFDILRRKAKEGVEVRLFYDDMGNINFVDNKKFLEKMRSNGIRCRVFNPFAPVVNAFLNNRDHRKITVIDGKVGFTGGYNLADEYFGITRPFGHWKDTGVKLTGQAVNSLTVIFLEMWNSVKTRDGKMDRRPEKYIIPESEYPVLREDYFVQPYADSPMDNEHVGEEVYMSVLEKSNDYFYIVTPYLVPSDEMIHALGLAAKRGVDVRIVTPGIPDKKMVYQLTRSYYSVLVRFGVRIYEYTPGFTHAKMCVADDRMATCGTMNLDFRSLYHHFENGCFFYGGRVVNDIKNDFHDMMAKSAEVTVEYMKENQTVWDRIFRVIIRLFAPCF